MTCLASAGCSLRAWGCMSTASQAREGLPFQGCWERTRCPLSPACCPPHPQALALTPATRFGSSPRGKGQSAGRQTRRNVWQSADAAPGREQTEAVCLRVICSFSEEPRPGAPERAERRRGRQGGGTQAGGLSHGARVGPPAQLRPFDSTSVPPLPGCPQLACERDTGSQGAAEGTGRRRGGCCCLTAQSPPELFGLNSSAPPGKGGLRLGALTSSPCKCPLFLPSHTPSCFPNVKPGLVCVGRTHNMCGAARTARTWAGFPHMPRPLLGH